jgi:hypothetical protein
MKLYKMAFLCSVTLISISMPFIGKRTGFSCDLRDINKCSSSHAHCSELRMRCGTSHTLDAERNNNLQLDVQITAAVTSIIIYDYFGNFNIIKQISSFQ